MYVLTSLSRNKEEVTSDIIFAVFSKASFAYSIYVVVLLMLVKSKRYGGKHVIAATAAFESCT